MRRDGRTKAKGSRKANRKEDVDIGVLARRSSVAEEKEEEKRRTEGKGKKGKSKGKNTQNGKHPSEVDQQQCRICLEYGHGANECPRRYVNQVQQAQPSQHEVFGGVRPDQVPRGPVPGSANPATHQQTTSASTIRRIFQIATPSVASSTTSPHVRMVSQQGAKHARDASSPIASQELVQQTVIWDSGSDVSLLPLSFGGAVDSKECSLKLQDCQGGSLQVLGHKSASLLAKSVDGEEIELLAAPVSRWRC